MSVTTKLLKLYRVDQQLEGLRSRLRAAEAYLKNQERLIAEIDGSAGDLKVQIIKLEAKIGRAHV